MVLFCIFNYGKNLARNLKLLPICFSIALRAKPVLKQAEFPIQASFIHVLTAVKTQHHDPGRVFD